MKSAILFAILYAAPALAQLRPDPQAAIAQELHIANQRENFRELREQNDANVRRTYDADPYPAFRERQQRREREAEDYGDEE